MSPEYAAYLRASGASEDEIRRNVQLSTKDLQDKQRMKAGGFANELRVARGGIQDEMQDRGMFSSGVRMDQDSLAIKDNAQRKAEFDLGIGQDINALNRKAAEDIARLRQGVAETGLQTRDQVGIANATAGTGG